MNMAMFFNTHFSLAKQCLQHTSWIREAVLAFSSLFLRADTGCLFFFFDSRMQLLQYLSLIVIVFLDVSHPYR